MTSFPPDKDLFYRRLVLLLTRITEALMEVLLLAFANSREHPLPTLVGEYAALNKNTLAARAAPTFPVLVGQSCHA